MSLQKFLSCLVIVVGLLAVFLLYGGLRTSPKELLRNTYHYSAMGWPSARIIQSMADEQSKLWVSFILVIIAFVLQFVAVFVPKEVPFTKTLQTSFILLAVVCIVLFFVLRLAQKGWQNYTSNEIKKEAIRDYLSDRYLRFDKDQGNVQGVKSISEEYFQLTKTDEMTWKDYIIKVSEKVGWTLPSDFILDNLKEPPQ